MSKTAWMRETTTVIAIVKRGTYQRRVAAGRALKSPKLSLSDSLMPLGSIHILALQELGR
jgi:hypothetical protein